MAGPDIDSTENQEGKTPVRAALASFMGSAVEYYDFFVFGSAAETRRMSPFAEPFAVLGAFSAVGELAPESAAARLDAAVPFASPSEPPAAFPGCADG